MSEKIPRNWEVAFLGNLGEFSKGRGISKNDTSSRGIPCIRYAEIYTDYDYVIKRFRSFISKDKVSTTKRLKENDIVFAGSGETVADIGKSVSFVHECEAYVGGDTIIFSPIDGVDSTFISYQLNDDIRRIQLRKLGQGSSIIHIYSSGLKHLRVYLPPFDEQQKIASIITSVDEVIENTQKQIDKLQDLKKATMNELLTKGIGHTEFKDSRLGRIPKSWDVVSISDLALIDRESLSSSTSPDYQFFYIDITSVKTCFINIPPTKIKYGDSPSRARRVVRKGDVLLSTVRPNLKAFAYVENDCLDWVCSTGFSVLSPKNDNDGRFIFYSVLSKFITKQIETLVVGSNYPAINSTDVKSLLVLRPSLSEQKKIASTLNSIDICIKDKQQKLHQTQSLKKSLMQDLLTGKVRVPVN